MLGSLYSRKCVSSHVAIASAACFTFSSVFRFETENNCYVDRVSRFVAVIRGRSSEFVYGRSENS